MDLIDRSALLKQAVPHVRGSYGGYSAKMDDWAVLVRDINAAPAVEAEPVVHAHWEMDEEGNCKCSACGEWQSYPDRYCRECGARMDEKVNDEEV